MNRPTFKLIPSSQLSESHFEEWPVWSEFYDYDELEEIVSWGVDREWLVKELNEKHSGSEHCVYPLLQAEPLPARMHIFIKADFTTAVGVPLKGYVMNEDAFVIGIFVNGREFTFSRHPALAEIDMKDRVELEGCLANSAVFPVSYRTDFKDCNGKEIAGEFP